MLPFKTSLTRKCTSSQVTCVRYVVCNQTWLLTGGEKIISLPVKLVFADPQGPVSGCILVRVCWVPVALISWDCPRVLAEWRECCIKERTRSYSSVGRTTGGQSISLRKDIQNKTKSADVVQKMEVNKPCFLC